MDQDSREAPLVLAGNEPTQRSRRRELPPPAGYSTYAPFWRRCIAWAVDELVKTGIYLVITLALYVVAGSVPTASPAEIGFQALFPRLLLSMGYDWLFWSQGWTPGASLMGMRIVRLDGGVPGARSAAFRVVASLVSSTALFLGYLWMLWSPRRQTWHDILGRTFVVMDSKDEPQK